MAEDDVTGANSGSYEEALAGVKARSGEGIEGPMPDAPTGAAVHVNPALDPAPAYAPVDRPPPVPVINDPGVIGAGPSLADLNAAARASYGIPETDQTSGITEDGNRDEIRAAAEQRQAKLLDAAKGETKRKAKDDAKPAKSGDKFGRASK